MQIFVYKIFHFDIVLTNHLFKFEITIKFCFFIHMSQPNSFNLNVMQQVFVE